MKNTLLLVLFSIAIFSCKEEKSIDVILQKVHAAMVRQDSVMKAAHDMLNKDHENMQKAYLAAYGNTLDSAHIRLEKAHTELLEKHDDIIDKHEVILRMHKRLIEKYNNGKFDKSFIEEEQNLLEEEHKLMQIDHDRLLIDHNKLQAEHDKLLVSLPASVVN